MTVPSPVDHEHYDDGYIRGILNTVKTIAMVGVSANTSRPSYFAFKYLLERGYRVIPVNPGLAGQDLLGQRVYARLGDIPEPVDMVDVFRASQYVPAIVEEMLAMRPVPRVLWMQLGVRNNETAARRSNTDACRPRFRGWASTRARSARSARSFPAAACSASRSTA
jgi:predicted CoA-binding protein